MKPRNPLLFLALALVLLATSGCSTTLVESLPVGSVSTCDAAWPGTWRGVEHGVGKAAMDEHIHISADCTQFTFSDAEKTQTEPHVLRLISTRNGQFLTFGNPGDAPKACFGEGNTHCGVELIRYVRSGGQILLYKPDHRRVHDALESHVISGYTEMNIDSQTTTANGTQSGNGAVPDSLIQARMAAQDDKKSPTYRNLIAGGPDQIAQILTHHPEFFEQDPYLILQREGPMNAGTTP
ncbi:MAG TPA: hypothetical protein VGH80_01220 [Xanthomonadaceae bacterium]